jgi:hypothetical protein
MKLLIHSSRWAGVNLMLPSKQIMINQHGREQQAQMNKRKFERLARLLV